MNILGDYFIINNELKPISIIESLTLPTGLKTIYEVFRVQNGIPLLLEKHLNRLTNSLDNLLIKHSIDLNTAHNLIINLIAKNNLRNCNIKISCFCENNTVKDYVMHFIPSSYPTEQMYKNGVNTILHTGIRENPNIKIANTTIRNEANKEIEDSHVFEALLVNHNGYITEGSRSNIFFIKNDTFYTCPQSLILPGIMRSQVISLIQKNNYQFSEECINTINLRDYNAAFITGTSPRILPIRKIEDIEFNPNLPLLRELMNKLEIYFGVLGAIS